MSNITQVDAVARIIDHGRIKKREKKKTFCCTRQGQPVAVLALGHAFRAKIDNVGIP